MRHFNGHPKVSSYISRLILNRFGLEKEYIDKICYLVENHDNQITEADVINNYALQLKRFEVQRCDALAHHPDKLDKRKNYIEKTKVLFIKNDNKGFILK